MTPLHLATYWGEKEIVELLIAAGADVNAKDMSNWIGTPLDIATHPENSIDTAELADLLRKHGGKTSDWLKAAESINIAAKAGHIEAVEQHLAAGTDVNAKDVDGWTPLDMAPDKETADLLRKHGGKTGEELKAEGK
jgi:ankyrin repeat protein